MERSILSDDDSSQSEPSASEPLADTSILSADMAVLMEKDSTRAASPSNDILKAKISAAAAKKKMKKPKDMPRRPLSAYNIFFREERARIMEELGLDKGKQPASSSSSSSSGATLFSALGKEVGKRWKELDDSLRPKYNLMAEAEMARYRKEMDEYHVRLSQKRRSEPISGEYLKDNPKAGQPPQSALSATSRTAPKPEVVSSRQSASYPSHLEAFQAETVTARALQPDSALSSVICGSDTSPNQTNDVTRLLASNQTIQDNSRIQQLGLGNRSPAVSSAISLQGGMGPPSSFLLERIMQLQRANLLNQAALQSSTASLRDSNNQNTTVQDMLQLQYLRQQLQQQDGRDIQPNISRLLLMERSMQQQRQEHLETILRQVGDQQNLQLAQRQHANEEQLANLNHFISPQQLQQYHMLSDQRLRAFQNHQMPHQDPNELAIPSSLLMQILQRQQNEQASLLQNQGNNQNSDDEKKGLLERRV